MILHPDGRVEGAPEEISAYMKLRGPQVNEQAWAKTALTWASTHKTSVAKSLRRLDERYPGDSICPYTTNVQSQAQYDAITASRAK